MSDIYLEFSEFCDNFTAEEKSNPELLIQKVEQSENRFGIIPEYYGLLASLYSVIGANEKAIAAYTKEIEFDSEDKPLHLLSRGCLYFDNRDFHKAAADFEEALEFATSRYGSNEDFIRIIEQSLSEARKHF